MGEFGKPPREEMRPKGAYANKTKFAEAKLAGKTNTEAYLYSRNGVNNCKSKRNLKAQADIYARKPNVREEVERLEREAKERAKMTPDAIVAKFEEIALDPNTKTEQVIAALDRLAKIASLYSENVNINHKVDVTMEEKKSAMAEWIEGLNGEAKEPSEIVRGEPGEVDNRE